MQPFEETVNDLYRAGRLTHICQQKTYYMMAILTNILGMSQTKSFSNEMVIF